jgi:glucose 1-dehydrogenase
MTDRRSLLVTGASAGIGAASARLAAERGWDVGVAYRSDQQGAATTAEAVEAAGGLAVLLQADLTVPEDIERMFSEFDAAFPRLDGVVNNAGIVDVTARVEDYDAARLTRMFATNLTGPFLVAGQAVRRMSTRHGGTGGVIVNVSSVAARLGSANQYVDYAASKAGIDVLTKGLADEVAADGIRVAGVRPGLILTQIHAKGGVPGRAERLAHLVPMQRAGTAEEVAQTILWLLSDAASYITGATIDVSGGR